MSFTPWRETAFLSHAFTAPRPSKADSSLVTSNQKVPATNNCKLLPADSSVQKSSGNAKIEKTCKDVNDSCETFDKRFILRTMQKQCSVEFLRKHFLNGSEDLVLKKRNKVSILSAYDEWRNMKNVTTNSKESELDDECTAQDGVNRSCNDASSNSGSSSSSSSSSSRLVDTFTVLYNRSKSSSALCSRTTVLLLHEDYPEELPIFTTINSKSKKVKEHDSLQMKDRVFSNGDVIVESDNDSHRVICVLGAVRDASDVEVEAAIRGRNFSRCMPACMCVCLHTCVYTCLYVCTYVWCVYTRLCACICMCDVYDCTAQVESFSVHHSVITIYTRSRIISSSVFYSDRNIIFDHVLTQLYSHSPFTASSLFDAAAERLGIRCVGANLGRTAEFTVKTIDISCIMLNLKTV